MPLIGELQHNNMGLCHCHSNGFSWRALIVWTTLVTNMLNSFFGVGCPQEEYEALLEFRASYNRTGLSSWGKQRDCCLWERVICDNSTKQVAELQLSDFLTYQLVTYGILDVQSWKLNLSIFSSFRELRHLNLSADYISGSLSSAGKPHIHLNLFFFFFFSLLLIISYCYIASLFLLDKMSKFIIFIYRHIRA